MTEGIANLVLFWPRALLRASGPRRPDGLMKALPQTACGNEAMVFQNLRVFLVKSLRVFSVTSTFSLKFTSNCF